MSSFPSIPLIALVATLSLLGWSLFGARKLGKLGILSWLQFASLMLPWVAYFGLFLAGIFINFAMLLLLLVTSTAIYVILGIQVRKVALEERAKLIEIAKTQIQSHPSEPKSSSQPLSPSPTSANISIDTPLNAPLNAIKADLQRIQGIFGIETYYVTEALPYQEGIIFRGNLRGDALEVHRKLSQALIDRFGNKYSLFFVEGQDRKPVAIVLPNDPNPATATVGQKILVVILLLTNILTCMVLGGQIHNIDLSEHPESFIVALPFAAGMFLILAVRELALRLVAKRYEVRLSLPFLLPSSQLGSFGSLTRIQSNLPNRKVLFDLAIAAPIASGLVSLLLLVVGLVLTASGKGDIEIPSQIFQSSILVGSIAKLILGKALHIDLVAIHFLVILGWIGSVITALNLLPAGQLDGGRIIQAVYGRKTAGISTLVTLILLAIATLINPLALYWGGIIFILLREQERPMLEELSELDSDRDALGLLALFWMLITLLPMTPAVAERFGIGN